ncbi:hypothetical protein, variant 1 [Aphanomyces astaci]|uniref:Ion transport domain-containing protein n=1 Tax=Aphanomyces astaci TaxID=112090 RepID=W4H892_APHAT|nr:hypothetical protein, variant 1 [Aphanomyces astaci]ETV87343.1 hypothetical protein, variant 1 [Aphanomyces astaci]|eukprot:XP_009822206.1 hypothetical protein, variant 1 [Aphanomyces astaci]
MTKVEVLRLVAPPPPMLKELRRKSTEAHVHRHHGPTAAEMRRCSTSIADLVNTLEESSNAMLTPITVQRKFHSHHKAPPPNTWRRRVRQLIKYPHATMLGRVRHYGLLFAIVVNFVPMMMETMDGPAHGGSDPRYPLLPSTTTYFYLDVVFTAVFGLDFAVRWVVAKRQRKFWAQLVTWIDVLGLLHLVGMVVMTYLLHWNQALISSVEKYLQLLRLFRIVRVTYMLRNVSGIRVLQATLLECVHPLQITLFFLVTIVMMLATVLYYAQPCYDDTKCTFTDIINTSYYIMVTVATVGYGDQVPDVTNPLAVVVATVAMIFGALYLAMPFAIIGIKYELTWRRFENVSRTTRSTLELHAALKAISIQPLHPQSNHANLHMHRTIGAIARLARLVDAYITIPNDRLFMDDNTLNQAFMELHAAGSHAIQTFQTLLSVLFPLLPPDFDFSMPRASFVAHPPGMPRRGSSLLLFAGDILTKARKRVGQLQRADTPINLLDPNLSFRRRLRFSLRSTSYGSWANRFYLSSVLLSVVVFYAESVPELQAFGPTSHLCHMVMEAYCNSAASSSVEASPGCYVAAATTIEPPAKVTFYCDEDTDPAKQLQSCFGMGLNYGGNESTMECATSFAQPSKVCNLRECKRDHVPVIDLTRQWIYIEVYLAVAFTLELSLRFYVSNHRRRFLRSSSTWIDILAIIPFYAQTMTGLAAGRRPVYVSSPVFPTLLSVLPIMKTIRILKLGWYFQGSAVLARTAALTYERLAIPLFFLFLACASAGAIFFEVERGTSCKAGVPCMYFHTDLMTAAIAAQFPYGKHIQLHVEGLVKLKDMWRTTWMSAVTLTGVGYGDLTPKTPAGCLFDMLTMVFGSCYTAMPLSLIGGQFYYCYEQYIKETRPTAQGVAKVLAAGAVHPPDPDVKVTSVPQVKVAPVLSRPACDLLSSARSIVAVVDEMMTHLYKLNRMRPNPVVLSIPLETSMVSGLGMSSSFTAITPPPRRKSLMARLASASMGGLSPVQVTSNAADKYKQALELRRLVRSALSAITTMSLQLPRVIETVVDMTTEVDDKS